MHLHLIQLAQYSNDYSDSSDSGGALSLLFGVFWFVLILGGSLWVRSDSRRYQIPCFGRTYDQEKDPTVWPILCFLCCLGFFYYFYRRSNIIYERGQNVSQTNYVETQAQTFKTPTTQAESATLEAKLAELQRLKDKGLITEAEFDQKRRQILGL